MTHTAIPSAELELFSELPDIKVVVDVGARADVSYLDVKPDITLHAYEPNPAFFKQLQEAVAGRANVTIYNHGIGDINGFFAYNEGVQGFVGGEAMLSGQGIEQYYPIIPLDECIPKDAIVDFLKIDTEGYDYKVLKGGFDTLKRTRFVQYEHWANKEQFHTLLEDAFDMEYVGYRNVLCMNRRLVPIADRMRLKELILKKEYYKLA